MRGLRNRLERALGSGTALALLAFPACGGSTNIGGASGASGNAGSGPGGDAGAAETGVSAGATATPVTGEAGSDEQALMPYPTDGLGCFGPPPDNINYYSSCCTSAYCYTPDPGTECVPANEMRSKFSQLQSSGACSCGRAAGPYAPNPADRPVTAATCCYVASIQSCLGRPLLVDGEAIVSELSSRADWLIPDLLEWLS